MISTMEGVRIRGRQWAQTKPQLCFIPINVRSTDEVDIGVLHVMAVKPLGAVNDEFWNHNSLIVTDKLVVVVGYDVINLSV